MNISHKKFAINIGYYNRVRYFPLEQANALIPLVIKITRHAYRDVQNHDSILMHDDLSDNFLKLVQKDKLACIEVWRSKLEKLGILSYQDISKLYKLESKNKITAAKYEFTHLDYLLFNTGHGYLVWQFPQTSIRFFCHYDAPISEKQNIENVQAHHPQWLRAETKGNQFIAKPSYLKSLKLSNA